MSSVDATWPFPPDPNGPGDYLPIVGWDVYDGSGIYLSSIATHPEIGGTIALVSEPRPLRIVQVFAHLGRVIVERT